MKNPTQILAKRKRKNVLSQYVVAFNATFVTAPRLNRSAASSRHISTPRGAAIALS